MKPLFVDTTGWMACVDAADPLTNRPARPGTNGRDAKRTLPSSALK
jgi:hypothetical protein